MKAKDIISEEQLKSDIQTRTKIFEIFKSGDDISVSLIQRKCSVGYFTASRTLENLINDDLVTKIENMNYMFKFI